MSEELLSKLEGLRQAHLDEGMAVTKAFADAVYPFDLLTYAVLNRSMSLTSGFVTLLRSDNCLAAMTLIRPQLDNFLRYAAGWLVTDPHAFATEILRGTPVKKQKTAGGAFMTDRFLIDHFKKEHRWIDQVYHETSGFIHLSEKHMLMNVTEADAEKRTATFSISDQHSHVPPQIRAEAIMCFAEITNLVLHRVYSWRYTKKNPAGRARKEPAKASTSSSEGAGWPGH